MEDRREVGQEESNWLRDQLRLLYFFTPISVVTSLVTTTATQADAKKKKKKDKSKFNQAPTR